MDSHRNELISLIQNNVITADILDEAVVHAKLLPNSQRWLTFLNQLCLWVGCIALSLSLVFFIAYNWTAFGKFSKFSLVQISLVLSVLAYMLLKKDSMLSLSAITLASILVGVFLALFGQTYQTGADPWQLFLIWACLITPWAIIARFPVLCLMVIGLINVSFSLYCDVHSNPLSVIFNHKINALWGLFMINLMSLIAWHCVRKKVTWLQDNWSMRLIALITGSIITTLGVMSAIDDNIFNNFGLPMWALCLGSGYWIYRCKTLDLFMLAGGCLSGILVIVTLCGHLLFRNGDNVVPFLILALVVIGLGAGAAWWLNSVQKEAHHES